MALEERAAMPLPSKDMAVYRSTHKLFEHRQYKRGLKVCEQLLRRNPGHAETMAMRALFLAHTGRRDEAHAQARDALRIGVRSFVCWHAYGLVHRAGRNYAEALKAYRTAARIETPPGNVAVLRDIAALQTQLRMHAALVETRLTILTMRPALRMHWIALAVAYDLAGVSSSAADLLGVVRTNFPVEEYIPAEALAGALVEEAELQLYRAQCLVRAGRLDDALVQLSAEAFGHGITRGADPQNPAPLRAASTREKGRRGVSAAAVLQRSPLPVDPATVLLLRGQTLVRRAMPGDAEAARAIGLRLLEANSDSEAALDLVLASVPHNDADLRHSLVCDVQQAHPSSLMLRASVLRTAPLDALPARLAQHIPPVLQRGVLCAADLLVSSQRVAGDAWDATQRSSAVDAFCADLAHDIDAAPHAAPARVMLAQHALARGDAQAALEHMEHALGAESAARNDILLAYARVLDAASWRECEAASAMAYAVAEAVRIAEPTDRYANSMAVRCALRAGRIPEAKTTAALFLRVRPAQRIAANAAAQHTSPSLASSGSVSEEQSPTASAGPVEVGDDLSGAAFGSPEASRAGDDQDDDGDDAAQASSPVAPECAAIDASPAVEEQLRDLSDMQASWFLLELGHAQHRHATAHSGDHDALRAAAHSFASVLRHHADFWDDQFDFHNYALRRMTLTAYVAGLLRWEDSALYGTPAYYAAAVGYLACRRMLAQRDASLESLSVADTPPTHDAHLDELSIADRLVAHHGDRRPAHALAFDVWMRRRVPITARVLRSLAAACGNTGVDSGGETTLTVELPAEHVYGPYGDVVTPVIAPPVLSVDLDALRRRIDLEIGSPAVRAAMCHMLRGLRSVAPVSDARMSLPNLSVLRDVVGCTA